MAFCHMGGTPEKTGPRGHVTTTRPSRVFPFADQINSEEVVCQTEPLFPPIFLLTAQPRQREGPPATLCGVIGSGLGCRGRASSGCRRGRARCNQQDVQQKTSRRYARFTTPTVIGPYKTDASEIESSPATRSFRDACSRSESVV